jgi:hypothetical protein
LKAIYFHGADCVAPTISMSYALMIRRNNWGKSIFATSMREGFAKNNTS